MLDTNILFTEKETDDRQKFDENSFSVDYQGVRVEISSPEGLGDFLNEDLLKEDKQNYTKIYNKVLSNMETDDDSCGSKLFAIKSLGFILTENLLRQDKDLYEKGFVQNMNCLYDSNENVRKESLKTFIKILPMQLREVLEENCFFSNLPRKNIDISKSSSFKQIEMEDIFDLSIVEMEAYRDVELKKDDLLGFMQEISKIQSYNHKYNCPNMSRKYIDSKGRIEAYLLACEGNKDGEKVLHIIDFASKKGSTMLAGKLLVNFLNDYKHLYIDYGKFIPITVSARDKTSYILLKNQLPKIEKLWGLKLEMTESSFVKGSELVHKVKVIPKKVIQCLM